MRVPVRLPLQQVDVGPFVGPRRATATVDAERLLDWGRRMRLFAYGGDVRAEDPLSLVYRGNLGARLSQEAVAAVEELPPPDEPQITTTSDVLRSSQTYTNVYVPPAAPAPYSPPFTGTTVQVPSAVATGDSPSYFQQALQAVPSILGSAAILTREISGAVQGVRPPTGQIAYTIPATDTAPAQRVTYNPATGQLITSPITAPSGGIIPSFFQGAHGAPWYQNPLVLLGGGLLALVLVVAVSRR